MGVTRPGPAGDETSEVFTKPESCRGLEFYYERMMLTAILEGGCFLDWLEFSMGKRGLALFGRGSVKGTLEAEFSTKSEGQR